jgi:hypothetical protein
MNWSRERIAEHTINAHILTGPRHLVVGKKRIGSSSKGNVSVVFISVVFTEITSYRNIHEGMLLDSLYYKLHNKVKFNLYVS